MIWRHPDGPGRGGAVAICRVLGERTVLHVPKGKVRRKRQRYPWADLLEWVFLVDVLSCRYCRGRRKVLAAIHYPDSTWRVLEALGLSPDAPELAQARGPPGEGREWA